MTTAFYVRPNAIQGDLATLEADEARHASTVLRMRSGDDAFLVDGMGTAYRGTITAINAKRVTVALHTRLSNYHEPPQRVILAFGLIKNRQRLEWIIEKGTELGVHSFQPLLTTRSERDRIRIDRLDAIALAAMKQSGRCLLPTIAQPLALSDLVAAYPAVERWLLAHESATEPFDAPAAPIGTIGVIIGPEGGFTPTEIEALERENIQPKRLGPTRLRAETAALAALSRILATSLP